MKKFETQVCQYVNDLLKDQRNTDLSRSAKKAIEVMRDSLNSFDGSSDSQVRMVVLDAVRQGKFSFGYDGYIVDLSCYFGERVTRALTDFVGIWLREFFLMEWIYDYSSSALHNELWEMLFWGMKDLYSSLIRQEEETRDKPQARKGMVAHVTELGSSNLLTLWAVYSGCTFVCSQFKRLYHENFSDVQQAFWESERSIWVLYQHLGQFRLPSLGEADEMVNKAFRKMSAFVSVLDTILLGGGV
jgi:hypothetical protein